MNILEQRSLVTGDCFYTVHTYIYIYIYIYIDVNIQMGIHSFIKISRDTIHYIRPVGPDHPNKTCTVAWVIAMVRD